MDATGTAHIDEHRLRHTLSSHGHHEMAGGETGPTQVGSLPVSLLTDPQLGARANAPIRAEVLRQTQASHGNRAVQRHIASGARQHPVPVQRAPGDEEEVKAPGGAAYYSEAPVGPDGGGDVYSTPMLEDAPVAPPAPMLPAVQAPPAPPAPAYHDAPVGPSGRGAVYSTPMLEDAPVAPPAPAYAEASVGPSGGGRGPVYSTPMLEDAPVAPPAPMLPAVQAPPAPPAPAPAHEEIPAPPALPMLPAVQAPPAPPVPAPASEEIPAPTALPQLQVEDVPPAPPAPAPVPAAQEAAAAAPDKYSTAPLFAFREPGKSGAIGPIPSVELPHQVDWAGKEGGMRPHGAPAGSPAPAWGPVAAHPGERLIDEGWTTLMNQSRQQKNPALGYLQSFTRYLETDQARDPFRVGINREANQLTLGGSNPAPLDTKGGAGLTLGAENEKDEFIYAMGGKGDIYAANMVGKFGRIDRPDVDEASGLRLKGGLTKPSGEEWTDTGITEARMHHSSFLAGGDVAAAGTIKAEGGQIKSISNASGHYRPSALHAAQFLHQLTDEQEGMGYKMGDDVKVHLHDVQVSQYDDRNRWKGMGPKEMSPADLLAYKQGGVVDKYFEMGKQEREAAERERDAHVAAANDLQRRKDSGEDIHEDELKAATERISSVNPHEREFAKYREFSTGLAANKSVAQMRLDLGLDRPEEAAAEAPVPAPPAPEAPAPAPPAPRRSIFEGMQAGPAVAPSPAPPAPRRSIFEGMQAGPAAGPAPEPPRPNRFDSLFGSPAAAASEAAPAPPPAPAYASAAAGASPLAAMYSSPALAEVPKAPVYSTLPPGLLDDVPPAPPANIERPAPSPTMYSTLPPGLLDDGAPGGHAPSPPTMYSTLPPGLLDDSAPPAPPANIERPAPSPTMYSTLPPGLLDDVPPAPPAMSSGASAYAEQFTPGGPTYSTPMLEEGGLL